MKFPTITKNFYIEKREGVIFFSLDSKLNVSIFRIYEFKNLVTCNSDENKNLSSTYLLYEIGL